MYRKQVVCSPSKRVEQRHDFRSSQFKMLLFGVAYHDEIVMIDVVLELSREENLQRRSHALSLQLSPQPALVAPHAIHYSRNIQELLAELKFQLARVTIEHETLVEVRRK